MSISILHSSIDACSPLSVATLGGANAPLEMIKGGYEGLFCRIGRGVSLALIHVILVGLEEEGCCKVLFMVELGSLLMAF